MSDIHREIVQRIFESKKLEESGFDAGSKHYSSAFGHYSCDGKPITRDDYFNAKEKSDSGNSDTKEKKSNSSVDPEEARDELINTFSYGWRGNPTKTRAFSDAENEIFANYGVKYEDDIMELSDEDASAMYKDLINSHKIGKSNQKDHYAVGKSQKDPIAIDDLYSKNISKKKLYQGLTQISEEDYKNLLKKEIKWDSDERDKLYDLSMALSNYGDRNKRIPIETIDGTILLDVDGLSHILWQMPNVPSMLNDTYNRENNSIKLYNKYQKNPELLRKYEEYKEARYTEKGAKMEEEDPNLSHVYAMDNPGVRKNSEKKRDMAAIASSIYKDDNVGKYVKSFFNKDDE